jgi:hypothetical protein
LAPLIEERIQELGRYEGFIDDIDSYEYNMQREFKHEVDEHKDLGPLLKDISKLVKKYTSRSDR